MGPRPIPRPVARAEHPIRGARLCATNAGTGPITHVGASVPSGFSAELSGVFHEATQYWESARAGDVLPDPALALFGDDGCVLVVCDAVGRRGARVSIRPRRSVVRVRAVAR